MLTSPRHTQHCPCSHGANPPKTQLSELENGSDSCCRYVTRPKIHQISGCASTLVGWLGPKTPIPLGLWEDPPFATMTIQCSAYSHVAGAKSLRHDTSRRTFDAGNSTGSKAISSAWCMGWLELPQRCSACQ